MALPSFLKRKQPMASPPGDAGVVQQARVSARRRLIGAAVLLAIGVIAFPLLFETQPRPIPVDIPIEIPRKDGVAPLAVPPRTAARTASGSGPDASARAMSEPAAPPVPQAAPKELPPNPPTADKKPASKPDPAREAPSPAPTPVPMVVPPAKPPVAAPSPLPTPATAARYVVQVGAFADATVARDVRLRVEKLGLKTYTQVIDTDGGKRTRVRIGPFESNDEAVKVLARLKAAKLPGAVLTL